MKSLKETLMIRDGLTSQEADKAIADCREDFDERLKNGEIPEDILMDHFGLEDDYILDLLDY